MQADLETEFDAARTDSMNNPYFGFDSGFSIYLAVPGNDTNGVLFIDGDSGANLDVPEPSTLLLLLGALPALGYRRISHRRGSESRRR